MENIQKTYLLGVEGVPALRGVSLKIKKGEFVIIYGKSGGGKTTMLNIIGTIDRPTKGHLTVCGRRIGAKTPDSVMAEVRLKRMGFVFQTFNLLSTMTALENVEMPMILRGTLSAKDRKKRAFELLEKVGMRERLDHLPSMMSGGEQQRVTIARAISNKPEILLLDEPTGDLDTVNSDIVISMLSKLNKENGITLVMVTHDQHLRNAAERIVHMRDGKIGRVEMVDPKKNMEFYQDLEDRLKDKNSEMVKKKVQHLKFSKMTEIRKPLVFYKYQSGLGKRAGEALLEEFCEINDTQVEKEKIDISEEVINIEPLPQKKVEKDNNETKEKKFKYPEVK